MELILSKAPNIIRNDLNHVSETELDATLPPEG
jgi:hypothetical protein